MLRVGVASAFDYSARSGLVHYHPSMNKFTPKAREQLKHYVYLLIDPCDDQVFYVGKGMDNRCFAHLSDEGESEKVEFIQKLRKLKLEPRIEILKYGLDNEEALLVESTAIDLLNVEKLTNRVRGFGSRKGSRGSVEEINATLDAKPIEINEPCILININRMYRPNMTVHDLYDATRSAWKVGPKRETAEYALSIYGGVIREIYEISAWVPGGTTMKVRDEDGRSGPRPNRFEFVGQIANDDIRDKYRGRSVAHYFKRGAQNPIQYVNC